MPEVHLTLYDRQTIEEHASQLPDKPPGGVRPGTWSNLRRGRAWCITWGEWWLAWQVFPVVLRWQLCNAPSSIPASLYDSKAHGSEVSTTRMRRPPWVPWDEADW